MCKERERERVGRIPSRQGGKGRRWAARRRVLQVFGRLRRARRGGGVQGVAELDVAARELSSQVVARPGDAHRVFIEMTSSRGWCHDPGLEGLQWGTREIWAKDL